MSHHPFVYSGILDKDGRILHLDGVTEGYRCRKYADGRWKLMPLSSPSFGSQKMWEEPIEDKLQECRKKGASKLPRPVQGITGESFLGEFHRVDIEPGIFIIPFTFCIVFPELNKLTDLQKAVIKGRAQGLSSENIAKKLSSKKKSVNQLIYRASNNTSHSTDNLIAKFAAQGSIPPEILYCED